MSASTSFSSPVTQHLNRLGIPYQVVFHSNSAISLEQAAAERGQSIDQIIRSLLFRAARQEFVMVLIAGKRQVSWKALRRYLGTSRLTMATDEEVLSWTGYPVGAVSPFGVENPFRLLVDQSALLPAEVSIGSGQRGIAILLSQSNFRKALNTYESGEFSSLEVKP